jgi:hypothetical protein
MHRRKLKISEKGSTRALSKSSQFINASSSLMWKNVFKLMLKIVELILQL